MTYQLNKTFIIISLKTLEIFESFYRFHTHKKKLLHIRILLRIHFYFLSITGYSPLNIMNLTNKMSSQIYSRFRALISYKHYQKKECYNISFINLPIFSTLFLFFLFFFFFFFFFLFLFPFFLGGGRHPPKNRLWRGIPPSPPPLCSSLGGGGGEDYKRKTSYLHNFLAHCALMCRKGGKSGLLRLLLVSRYFSTP